MDVMIPIHNKIALSIQEAAEYSGIGVNKLRELIKLRKCPFVLYVGRKILIKRKPFEEYIENQSYI